MRRKLTTNLRFGCVVRNTNFGEEKIYKIIHQVKICTKKYSVEEMFPKNKQKTQNVHLYAT